MRFVQVRAQVTVDRAAGGCGAHGQRLGAEQLDATEAAGGLADEAYP